MRRGAVGRCGVRSAVCGVTVMNIYKVAFILYLPERVPGIGVKIDGLIDLGPKWSYNYKISPLGFSNFDTKNNKKGSLEFTSSSVKIRKDNKYKKKTVSFDSKELTILEDEAKQTSVEKIEGKLSRADVRHVQDMYTNSGLRASTQILPNEPNENFESNSEENIVTKRKKKKKHDKHNRFTKGKVKSIQHKTIIRKVKDDCKIRNFTLHIYKQSLKLFDKLREISSNGIIKHKFEVLKNMFTDKFADFVKVNEENSLKTNSSLQKVILNIIDTSNIILQRLANLLAKDINDHVNMYTGTVNVFQNEIKKEKEIENVHACKKLAACRSKDNYVDFVIDVVSIILLSDNHKIKQAGDALTEVVKENDYSNIIDAEVEGKIKKLMDDIEKMDAFLIRAMFTIFNIVLINKNKPIIVADSEDVNLANKTIAFHELMGAINKHMSEEKNKGEWEEIKKELEEWKEDKRSDIQTILGKIVKQLIRELEKLDYKLKQKLNELIKLLFKLRVKHH